MASTSFVLLLSLSAAVFAEDLPIAIPRRRTVNAVLDAPGTAPQKSCQGNRIDCGSCSTVLLCNYQNETVGWYDCASVDPSRPYCTGTGVCSNTVESSCETKSDLCPGPSKIYPDPANCASSVYCDDELQATRISSPTSGYVFNFTSQSWSLRRTNADCFQINCAAAGQQNAWLAYKPAPRLSIYCGLYGPMTFECEGANLVFNESTKRCDFACLSEGNFPHPTDTTLYYMCLPTTSGKLQVYEMSCPSGMRFNLISKICK